MNHSIVTFRGPAALPGIYMLLTRVNRGADHFFSLAHTGHRKAGYAFSPLNSISYHLSNDLHIYPVRTGIDARGWRVEECAFRMWTIGRIDHHPDCTGFSFDDCCLIALILSEMIRKHLDEQGHQTVGYDYSTVTILSDHPLARIVRLLFEEYLHAIFPSLLEDMDLNSHNSDLDRKREE